jgi:lipopolysaccharide export LptBFGC system permease protein LptF
MQRPWTIWRYVLGDLWKQILLITLVLTTIIAFGFSVKFLAEGKLGPMLTLKFIALAFVPMLQYSLPFAAAFGATLVYHRMSHDNELSASYAGGLSHRVLIVPAALTGAMLAVVLLVLTQMVIPRFLRTMQRMVTQDASAFITATIEQGRPLMFENWAMLADTVRSLGPHEGSGAYERLLLTGVVFVELNDEGDVIREGSAASGRVFFFAGDDPAAVESATRGAVFGEDRGTGLTLVRVELEQSNVREPGAMDSSIDRAPLTMPIRDVINDDPKFLTFSELRAVPRNPDAMSMIDQRRRDLAVHLAERLATQRLLSLAREQKPIVLSDAADRRITVLASGMRWDNDEACWTLQPAKGKGVIEVRVEGREGAAPGATPTVLEARRATLKPDIGPDRASRALSYTLSLSEGTREGGADQAFTRLVPIDNPEPALLRKTSAELLTQSKSMTDVSPGDNASLANPTRDLRQRITRLIREVVSKQHERVAMAASCLVMVFTGAVTAMRMGGAIPLAVYLWSFFPALVSVITIAMGQQLTHHQGYAGLIVLWGGVGALAAYALAAFRIVRRH